MQSPFLMRLLTLTLLLLLVACSVVPGTRDAASPLVGAQTKKAYKDLVVGYAQIGAESEWRTANTQSIQETALQLGVTLSFRDAQQKQENQIKAMRSFIAQKVDVIGLSPVVETGWEEVFNEAKAAGIPIILVDRRAKLADNLYASFIGSDFNLEGQKACEELDTLLNHSGTIVELEGTSGSAPAIGRKTGFHDCLAKTPTLKVLASQSGDFTRSKGKQVMQEFLKTYAGQINALYAHNDDMALGAIEAIEEAGLKPGKDIKIVSIDGVRGAFEAMIAGKLNTTIECNPLLGPQFFETALKIVNGESVDKWVKSNESVFRQDVAPKELPNRKY